MAFLDCTLGADLTLFVDPDGSVINDLASLSRSALASCSSWVPRTSLYLDSRMVIAGAAGAAVESGVASGGPRVDDVSGGPVDAPVEVLCFLGDGERSPAGAVATCPVALDEATSGGLSNPMRKSLSSKVPPSTFNATSTRGRN